VQALTGEKRAKMLGKSDRERKLHDTSTTELAGKQSGGSFSRALKSFLFIEKKGSAQAFEASESTRSGWHTNEGALSS
jgi:hypothetical protein